MRLDGDRASIGLSPAGQRLLPHVLDADRTGHVGATPSDPDADGWVEAEVPPETWTYAAMDLIRFGRGIGVLAPADPREAVRELSLAVADRHGTGT